MLHPNGVFNLWGEGVAKKGRTQVWSKQLRFGSNWMKSFWSCSVIYCTWNIRTHWDLDDRHVWFQPSQRRHRPPSNPERASCFQWQWLVYKHTYATEWTSISNTWGRFKIMLLWLAFYSFSRGISCQFKKKATFHCTGPQTRWLWLYGVSCATMSHMCSLGWNHFWYKWSTFQQCNASTANHDMMYIIYKSYLHSKYLILWYVYYGLGFKNQETPAKVCPMIKEDWPNEHSKPEATIAMAYWIHFRFWAWPDWHQWLLRFFCHWKMASEGQCNM